MKKESRCTYDYYKETFCEYENKFGKDSLVHTGLLEIVNMKNRNSLIIAAAILGDAIRTGMVLPQYSNDLWDDEFGVPQYEKISTIFQQYKKLKSKKLNCNEPNCKDLKIEEAIIKAYLKNNILNYHSLSSFTSDRIVDFFRDIDFIYNYELFARKY